MRIRCVAVLVCSLMVMAGCDDDDGMGPSPGGSTVSIVVGASTLTTTAFSPNPINVSPGTTITWRNDDTVTHTSTSTTGVWDSGSLAPNASFSRTFPSAGTFPYLCTIHPNMVGTVNVQ